MSAPSDYRPTREQAQAFGAVLAQIPMPAAPTPPERNHDEDETPCAIAD